MHLAPSARRSRVPSFALAATVGCAFSLTSCSNMEDVNKVNPTRLGVAASFESLTNSFQGGSDVETQTVGIELDGGHRVVDGLEVGALLSWTSEEVENDNFAGTARVTSTTERVLFGPQARYYFISEGQVQPWVTAAVGIANIELDFDEPPISYSESGSFVQGGVGVSYFASRWVAIETAFTFGRVSIDESDIDYTALNVGLSVFF